MSECIQSSARPNQSDRRMLSPLNVILYVLCASAVALLSMILNNPEAMQEGMYTANQLNSLTLFLLKYLLNDLRNAESRGKVLSTFTY